MKAGPETHTNYKRTTTNETKRIHSKASNPVFRKPAYSIYLNHAHRTTAVRE